MCVVSGMDYLTGQAVACCPNSISPTTPSLPYSSLNWTWRSHKKRVQIWAKSLNFRIISKQASDKDTLFEHKIKEFPIFIPSRYFSTCTQQNTSCRSMLSILWQVKAASEPRQKCLQTHRFIWHHPKSCVCNDCWHQRQVSLLQIKIYLLGNE